VEEDRSEKEKKNQDDGEEISAFLGESFAKESKSKIRNPGEKPKIRNENESFPERNGRAKESEDDLHHQGRNEKAILQRVRSRIRKRRSHGSILDPAFFHPSFMI
jgi:hypothetical protein